RPGVELVYVLEGAGYLEADGKPKVALNPGAVTTIQPKQRHVLKNASQTRPLKALVVLRPPAGSVRRQQADEQPIFRTTKTRTGSLSPFSVTLLTLRLLASMLVGRASLPVHDNAEHARHP